MFRAIIQGTPGSGKTSLLASAANAGYRILLADFDHCADPLLVYTTPEGRTNVHIIPFDDDRELDGDEGVKRRARGAKAFERFLYSGKVGAEMPFGHPREWGDRTILALDTLTTLGECCEARACELNPAMPYYSNAYQAAQDQENIVELMLSRNRVNAHVIVLSHLRLVSPKAESQYVKTETELQKQIKRERAALQETGYFPTMVIEGIARNVVRHFPFALLAEDAGPRDKTESGKILRTKPITGYQIKAPLDIPDRLPVETALATILAKVANGA